MIIEYQRPKNMQEALGLLARQTPKSYPLGGGTVLNQDRDEEYAVIDLQELGLGGIARKGNQVWFGATATLQDVLDYRDLPADMYAAVRSEATYNLRHMATVAGRLVTANGRSPFCTVMLGMDASFEYLEGNQGAKQIRLGDWLPVRNHSKLGSLITRITIAMNLKVAYEKISRTPADQPIVCASVAQWASGRTRLALGGWGGTPIVAMDGPTSDGIEIAAKNAYVAAEDEWASAEYRSAMAAILAGRCIKRLNEQS